jgi:hypothetical protein
MRSSTGSLAYAFGFGLAVTALACDSSPSKETDVPDASTSMHLSDATTSDARTKREDARDVLDAGPDRKSGVVDASDAHAPDRDSSTHEAGDASSGEASMPPAVPAAPQVIDFGGTILTTPKFQLIAYASDPTVSDAEAFMTELGTTTEWATQTDEYGVGAFAQLATILIDGTPPASLDDNGQPSSFRTTLANNTSGTNPVWGAADPTTVYLFLLPAGTTISTSQGTCCTNFFGYHSEATVGADNVPYAVVCDCAAAPGDPYTPLEHITTTMSREMVEAATDPFVNSGPAYRETDQNDIIWTFATGGEVADMCVYDSDSSYRPPASTYMLGRSWSNAAAAAGNDPCVPVASAAPYFNSYAIYDDSISLYGGAIMTTGVSIPVGQSKTLDVVLSSPGGAGVWTVTPWDYQHYLGKPPNTTLALDQTSGSDGDVLHLTVTVSSYDATTGGAGVVLESTLNGQDNLTMFAIGE